MPYLYFDAIKNLAPGAEFAVTNENYNSIQWFSPDIPKPTQAEVDTEYNRLVAQQPLQDCKQRAQQLLDESDWATKSDVTDTSLHPHLVNAADFVAYRLALRTLRINPEADPIWPARPTEIWSS